MGGARGFAGQERPGGGDCLLHYTAGFPVERVYGPLPLRLLLDVHAHVVRDFFQGVDGGVGVIVSGKSFAGVTRGKGGVRGVVLGLNVNVSVRTVLLTIILRGRWPLGWKIVVCAAGAVILRGRWPVGWKLVVCAAGAALALRAQ